MIISDETLMAYADGELDGAERTEVEAAIAADPLLTQQLHAQRVLRQRLQAAMNEELAEPVPERLLHTARTAPAGAAAVSDLVTRRMPRARVTWPRWTAWAASLVIGALLGSALMRNAGDASLMLKDGRLLAQGELGSALNTQLASNQAGDDRIHIGLSFRDGDGQYCRTFVIRDAGATAGLACRTGKEWSVQATAPGEPLDSEGSDLRLAATALPPEILRAVETRISGDALDVDAEREAQRRGWQN